MHSHLIKPIRQTLERNRIIEILGRVGVDGHGRHRGKIPTLRTIRIGNCAIQPLGLKRHLLGINVGQLELRQDRIHLGIIIPILTKDIAHGSDWAFGIHGPRKELHDHLIALPSAMQLLHRDKEIYRDTPVVRHKKGSITRHLNNPSVN